MNIEEKLKKNIKVVAALLNEPIEHIQIELIGYLKGKLAGAIIEKRRRNQSKNHDDK